MRLIYAVHRYVKDMWKKYNKRNYSNAYKKKVGARSVQITLFYELVFVNSWLIADLHPKGFSYNKKVFMNSRSL